MAYCTNCGKESSKKICESCGVKRNATHKYCAFGGAELPEKAALCTNCKEPIKGEAIIWNIINILLSIPLMAVLLMAIGEGQPIFVIACLTLSFALCLPFIKSVIRNTTIGKKGLRKVLKLVRNLTIVVFFVVGMNNLNVVETEITVYKDEATAAAEVVFHEEVNLKNESSYVLNGSDVQWQTTPYKDVEGSRWRLVWVTLDYSAQNGFGGTNRETYKVEMLFDITDGTYHRIDGGSQIYFTLPNQ